MRSKSMFRAVVAFLVLTGSPFARAALTEVPGTSNPWLAGMPAGSLAGQGPNIDPGVDVAPAESPAQVTNFAIFGGETLYFSATGLEAHGADIPFYGPNGGPDGGFTQVINENGPQNGIGNITTEMDSLVGVFLDDNQPSLFTPPAALNFSSTAAQDASPLSPLVRQPFFIGTGFASGGAQKQYIVPAGATRLFLGTMDVYKWYDNQGSFTVNVIPEPASFGLLGLAGIAALMRRRRV
jgi:hypothetical protein